MWLLGAESLTLELAASLPGPASDACCVSSVDVIFGFLLSFSVPLGPFLLCFTILERTVRGGSMVGRERLCATRVMLLNRVERIPAQYYHKRRLH